MEKGGKERGEGGHQRQSKCYAHSDLVRSEKKISFLFDGFFVHQCNFCG